jgi:TonB family protein
MPPRLAPPGTIPARVLCLAVALWLTGCASGGPSLPSADDPGCGETTWSRMPAELSQILDLVPVADWVAAHATPQEGTEDPMYALFSVRYAGQEELRWVRPLAGNLPDERLDDLGRTILAALDFPDPPPTDPLPSPDARPPLPPGPFRIEVSWGEEGIVTAAHPSVNCAPQFRDREAIALAMNEAAREHGLEGSVLVDVFVDADGRPGDIRIDEAITGTLRREVERIISGIRFEPARLDGLPVQAWTRFPMTFVPPGR